MENIKLEFNNMAVVVPKETKISDIEKLIGKDLFNILKKCMRKNIKENVKITDIKELPMVINKKEEVEEGMEIIDKNDNVDPLFWIVENVSPKEKKDFDKTLTKYINKNNHKWIKRDDSIFRLINLNKNKEIVDNLLDMEHIIDGPGEPSIFASYYNNDGSLGWLTIPISMEPELTEKIFSDPLFILSSDDAAKIIEIKNKENPLLKHAMNIDFSNADFIKSANKKELKEVSEKLDDLYKFLNNKNMIIPRMRVYGYKNPSNFKLVSDMNVKIPFQETNSLNTFISGQKISINEGEFYLDNINNPEEQNNIFSGLIRA